MPGRRIRTRSAAALDDGPLHGRAPEHLAQSDGLLGIAAPHVSPEGGWHSYQAAYGALAPEYKDRTFVVLGTSHYGEPERFGLTRKPFVTPLGESRGGYAAGGSAGRRRRRRPFAMEDYCHAVEHSIEFQVLFLQHLYGPDIRDPADPVRLLRAQHLPWAASRKQDEDVRRFLDALGEMAAREAGRLFWVLGIDMAHMGRRYGDRFTARADEGAMQRDRGARPRPHRPDRRRRRRRLLGPGAGEAGRSEVVRLVAALHVSESGAAGARESAALRAVEYRRAERGQLRGHRVRGRGFVTSLAAPAYIKPSSADGP